MDIINFFKRTKNILITPAKEWEIIALETGKYSSLVLTFALPWIILCSLAKFAGLAFFSDNFEFLNAFIQSFIQFFTLFTAVYFTSKITYRLAPSFQSVKDEDQAFRLIIYTCVPVFVSTFFVNLFPSLFPLKLLYLYSIYLINTGITSLMKTPDDQKIGYMLIALIILAGIVLAMYRVMNFIIPALPVNAI